jgi:hypothetical protein
MLRGFMQNHAGLNLLSCYKPVREADEAHQACRLFIPVLRKVSEWVHPPWGWWGQNVGWRRGMLGGRLLGRERALTAGEGSYRLGVLWGLSPLSWYALRQAAGEGSSRLGVLWGLSPLSWYALRQAAGEGSSRLGVLWGLSPLSWYALRQAAGEGSSRLGDLLSLPPLSLDDMLHNRTWHFILSYPCLSLGNIFPIL